MINVEILSKVKPGGNSYSSRTASSFKQVSSNSGGGSTSFTPRVLWGQRFDGTQDVYGDMTIRGRIDECTGLAVSGNAGIGGSLTVDSTADVTYQLADGSKYSANRATSDWDSK